MLRWKRRKFCSSVSQNSCLKHMLGISLSHQEIACSSDNWQHQTDVLHQRVGWYKVYSSQSRSPWFWCIKHHINSSHECYNMWWIIWVMIGNRILISLSWFAVAMCILIWYIFFVFDIRSRAFCSWNILNLKPCLMYSQVYDQGLSMYISGISLITLSEFFALSVTNLKIVSPSDLMKNSLPVLILSFLF